MFLGIGPIGPLDLGVAGACHEGLSLQKEISAKLFVFICNGTAYYLSSLGLRSVPVLAHARTPFEFLRTGSWSMSDGHAFATTLS